ncbi:hypothetical protein M426DRAFT_321606 [Hypoxylon sp. CI-4A]|nr:hypothetical protein M426DRAFT_321606 [Hypoxylon sp. CI-4A]
MKLVIGGSSGFVGTEIVRQALGNPDITSIVGLSRRETPVPSELADHGSKLKSIICDDFENYPDAALNELEDSDACIWTIAITPSKFKTVPWEETVKICRDYTLTAIQTLAVIPRKNKDKPLRFVYISGHFVSRERTPEMLSLAKEHGLQEMLLMRGDVESKVLAYARQSDGAIEACIARPGFVDAPGKTPPNVPGLPHVELRDLAAALLDQVLHGFDKDTLLNDDLSTLGQKALA